MKIKKKRNKPKNQTQYWSLKNPKCPHSFPGETLKNSPDDKHSTAPKMWLKGTRKPKFLQIGLGALTKNP